ncbi:MAG TPA: hypothetical protein VK727_08765 [Steroidobacteraceae bacterium]|nr:hypothetical protein [Steroidobacteraceae bacterium]
MIEILPNFTTRRRWWHWAVAILIADLVWFCSMYPVVPRTAGAAVLEALLPMPLLIYVYAAARCVLWISQRPWSSWTRLSVGAAIALAAGVVGIWMVDWAVIHTSAEYGYLMIRRL